MKEQENIYLNVYDSKITYFQFIVLLKKAGIINTETELGYIDIKDVTYILNKFSGEGVNIEFVVENEHEK